MNEDYELFEWSGTTQKYSMQMKSIDTKLPPAKTIERGADAIRTYWNGKNLRKRKAND